MAVPTGEVARSVPPAAAERSVSRVLRAYALVWVLPALVVAPFGVIAAGRDPLEAVLWTVFATAANLLALPILPRLNFIVTMGAPVNVAAAVVLSPTVAVLVTALGFTTPNQFRRDVDIWAVAFNRAQVGLSVGAASYLAHQFAMNAVLATAVAALVYSVVNTAAVTGRMRLKYRLRLETAARDATAPIPRFAVDFALVALLALFVVLLENDAGTAALLALVLPLWLGYSALRSARESEDRAEQLAARVRELETFSTASTALLGAHDLPAVEVIGRRALRTALDTDAVVVSRVGEVPATLQTITVAGAEPAAIGVPAGLDERSYASADTIAGLLGMAMSRLALEEELRDVQRARSALSGRILEEATHERSRIALAIHDEVLPYLAATEIQADNVRSALADGALGSADDLARRLRDASHDGIARLREVLEALRQQIIVPGDLRPSLVGALADLRLHHGIDGILDATDPLPPLPLPVEILLSETVRGCLANVVLHAHAETVRIAVATSDKAITVTVSDDGSGFDAGAVSHGHQGLVLMRQRVELARGRFRVDSRMGKGTVVQMEVPL